MVYKFTVNTLLIDGNYLMKRSFNGAKHTFNGERHIGGLYQFIIQTRSLIRSQNINKVVVFWDGENSGKLRYDIYNEYKANREGKEWYKKIDLTPYELRKQQQEKESYLWQMVRVKNYLEELFIRQVQVDKIESDDMISYYCQKYHDKENITIYTNDRDICQLLEYDNVSVYLANLKQNVTKKNYYLLFKHHYTNLTIIKTMCGDDSDNISGIDGLGENTLIKYFPKIQTQKVKAATIIKEARDINEQRINNKKKPLKVLENIYEGIFKTFGKVGLEQYKLNYKIINLLEPFLTKEAMAELCLVAEEPLDPNGRGEENLLKMMSEDSFLQNFNADFIRFHEPFYPVIIREKDFYKKNTHI
jgi:5'-3' exonuclease